MKCPDYCAPDYCAPFPAGETCGHPTTAHQCKPDHERRAEPRMCPYASDVHADDRPCLCCDDCRGNCADEI